MVHYRILFIVNPISGFGLGWEIPYRIRHIAAYKDIEYNIRFTEYAGHVLILDLMILDSGSLSCH